jgi:hypothetical protein
MNRLHHIAIRDPSLSRVDNPHNSQGECPTQGTAACPRRRLPCHLRVTHGHPRAAICKFHLFDKTCSPQGAAQRRGLRPVYRRCGPLVDHTPKRPGATCGAGEEYQEKVWSPRATTRSMYLPLVEFVGEIGAICFHSGLGRSGFNFVQLLCALIVRFVMLFICLLACCLIAPHRGNNIRSAPAAGGSSPAARQSHGGASYLRLLPVRVVLWSLSGCHGVLLVLLSLSCTCCCAHVP